MASRKLNVDILLKGAEKVNKELSVIEKKGEGTASKIGASFKSLGPLIGAGIVAGAGLAIKELARLGMEAEETRSLVKTSFGDMTADIQRWANVSVAGLVSNKLELQANTAQLFNIATQMGLTREESFKLSTGYSELSADLASFNNMRPEEVHERLRASMTGEFESLKSLGIVINESVLKHEQLERAAEGANYDLNDMSDKAQLIYEVITEKADKAVGDLGRTIDSTANQAKIAAARMSEMRQEIGDRLTPFTKAYYDLLLDVVKKLDEYISKTGKSSDESAKMVIQIGAITAGGTLAAVAINAMTAALTTFAGKAIIAAGAGYAFGRWAGGLYKEHLAPAYEQLPPTYLQGLESMPEGPEKQRIIENRKQLYKQTGLQPGAPAGAYVPDWMLRGSPGGGAPPPTTPTTPIVPVVPTGGGGGSGGTTIKEIIDPLIEYNKRILEVFEETHRETMRLFEQSRQAGGFGTYADWRRSQMAHPAYGGLGALKSHYGRIGAAFTEVFPEWMALGKEGYNKVPTTGVPWEDMAGVVGSNRRDIMASFDQDIDPSKPWYGNINWQNVMAAGITGGAQGGWRGAAAGILPAIGSAFGPIGTAVGGLLGGLLGRRKQSQQPVIEPIPVKVMNWSDITSQMLNVTKGQMVRGGSRGIDRLEQLRLEQGKVGL